VLGSGDTEVLDMLHRQPLAADDEDFLEREYRRRVLAWAAERIRHEFRDSTWQAFWQTNVEGKDTNQVAAALGMSVGAVYIARSRVLGRLKMEISQVEEEE
jgi:RNA polymerase sigma-70 factor (ECF subfamily)